MRTMLLIAGMTSLLLLGSVAEAATYSGPKGISRPGFGLNTAARDAHLSAKKQTTGGSIPTGGIKFTPRYGDTVTLPSWYSRSSISKQNKSSTPGIGKQGGGGSSVPGKQY